MSERIVKREDLFKTAQALKNVGYDLLIDLFGIDFLHWEEKELRFEVIYNLFSSSKNQRVFLKVAVPEKDPAVDSMTALWPAADWYEREVWDMFGIRFIGHPNLKRLLMYEEFQGHPLRKDYPYNKRQPLIGPMN